MRASSDPSAHLNLKIWIELPGHPHISGFLIGPERDSDELQNIVKEHAPYSPAPSRPGNIADTSGQHPESLGIVLGYATAGDSGSGVPSVWSKGLGRQSVTKRVIEDLK